MMPQIVLGAVFFYKAEVATMIPLPLDEVVTEGWKRSSYQVKLRDYINKGSTPKPLGFAGCSEITLAGYNRSRGKDIIREIQSRG